MSEEMLERFGEEVLSGGAEACLPCNLSDEWLDVLTAQAEGRCGEHVVELVAALTAILAFKNMEEDGRSTVRESEIRQYIDDYQLELGLEQVSRHTELEVEPATLMSIFTEREVLVTRRSALSPG